VLQYHLFVARDLYRRAFTAEMTMNDDDDKTVIQTEEDRRELEKRLRLERSNDASADESNEPDQAEKSDD